MAGIPLYLHRVLSLSPERLEKAIDSGRVQYCERCGKWHVFKKAGILGFACGESRRVFKRKLTLTEKRVNASRRREYTTSERRRAIYASSK